MTFVIGQSNYFGFGSTTLKSLSVSTHAVISQFSWLYFSVQPSKFSHMHQSFDVVLLELKWLPFPHDQFQDKEI